MNSKVVPFPMQIPATTDSNVLWIVAVHSTLKDEYSCEYKSKENRWSVHVQSGTFAGAMALVAQCCGTIGQSQAVNSSGVRV